MQQAPSGPTGILTGTVTDRGSGAGIGGATVAATGEVRYSTITGPDGSYRLRLPVGSHAVAAEDTRYLPDPVPGVEIAENLTTNQNFALEPIPVMAVDPFELNPWQRPDTTASHPVTISNDGAADLAWQVVEDGTACGTTGTPPWVTLEPASGSVAAGAQQQVQVVVDSTGLAEGELAGDVCLAGNEHAEPVAISLTLLVDEQPPDAWVQRDALTPSDRTDKIDGFGKFVAVDGDTAVALACTTEGGSAAYVYTRSGACGTRPPSSLRPVTATAARRS